MKQPAAPAQYLQIAQDLAARIARGDLPEGSRIYGRSVMASEYQVSPETIRRALWLLADMKVVEVRPQSGAVVLSAENAQRCMEVFGENAGFRALRRQLKDLLQESDRIHVRIRETVTALTVNRDPPLTAEQPLPNYEVPVPADSAAVGKSIAELHFWQETAATVAAIRREETLLLSPGPDACLCGGDVLILVGTSASAVAVHRLLET